MISDDTRWSGAFEQLDGLEELYARWSPLVYSFALACLGEVAEAEEVTRRVFVEVHGAGPLPEVAAAETSARLIGLARAAVADLGTARGGPGSPPPTVLAKDSGGGESKPARLTELLVSDEISQQVPVREQVLRMALGEGLTSAQIAERTELPVDEVTDHLTRGLLALRDRLAVDDDPR